MKLSEAGTLGSSLKRRGGRTWIYSNPATNEQCGCFIGGALLAIGRGDRGAYTELSEIRDAFPWVMQPLTPEQEPKFAYKVNYYKANKPVDSFAAVCLISDLYDAVCRGEITEEQLADWVRSVEPACGDCNRFNCDCAARPASEELVEMSTATG